MKKYTFTDIYKNHKEFCDAVNKNTTALGFEANKAGISFEEACKRLSLLTTISNNTKKIKNSEIIKANSKHKNKFRKRKNEVFQK